ncbi:sarcosine oxidase subunit gamma [Anderseniella sp. Alg231-50]|uniref:sarcosine oxidase subunit gamma n=1 Tax=Anderseniella sp. Alg231-50 TaxID=1922226 RepID=UPI00307B6636
MSEAVHTSPLAHLDGSHDAAELSISISEVADRGMIDLRGEAGSVKFRQAAKTALGIDLPLKPRSTAVKGDVTVLWLSVDQWLVCCPRNKAAGLVDKLRKNLDTLHSLVVDVSDARAIIRLEGDNAREVMMKGSSIDFTLPDYKTGLVRRLVFAEIAALAHIVTDKPCTIDIYVFRSFADYTWKWIEATAKPAATIGLFGARSE